MRIVTSGFFQDEDEDGVHTLSQGDSSQFRTLLSSLLGANSQQVPMKCLKLFILQKVGKKLRQSPPIVDSKGIKNIIYLRRSLL